MAWCDGWLAAVFQPDSDMWEHTGSEAGAGAGAEPEPEPEEGAATRRPTMAAATQKVLHNIVWNVQLWQGNRGQGGGYSTAWAAFKMQNRHFQPKFGK